MSKKVISFSLDTKDINRAIREVNRFKKDFQDKVDTYRVKLAEAIATAAIFNFENSLVDDVINGTPRKPDVKVSVSSRGNISVIAADGEDAVWCEFGSGVYNNGAVGVSPNPLGSELGFTIGSYGKGHGRQQAWGYRDEKGNIVITRGTPATMPMYNAVQEVLQKSVEIAREVFK